MNKVSDSFIEQIFNNKKKASYGFFDKNKAETFVEELYQVLFIPQHKDTEEILKNSFEKLQNILFELINNTTDDKSLAERQMEVLFHALPEIYDKQFWMRNLFWNLIRQQNHWKKFCWRIQVFLQPISTGFLTSCGRKM